MMIVSLLLVTGSALVAAVGLMLSSQATLGVAVIALACYAAILGRITQAIGQHGEIVKAMRATQPSGAAAVVTSAQGENDVACPHCGARNTRGPSTCQSCGQSLRGAKPTFA